MDAFFQDLGRRIAFAQELHDQRHDNEAMLLCCCYIDGLANNLYPDDDGSHRNFVRDIGEYGATEWLTRIHPRQLSESLGCGTVNMPTREKCQNHFRSINI